MINPQVLQTAIAGAANAHTGLHQVIHELRNGSVTEAKQILARQIAGESERKAWCCSGSRFRY
ncbi:hypothetical protein [Nostoc sp. MG11]|uniref:hypothetical protein n=1 Tax=Nostoc sp. MG11 TaxID=2721166 RepID=UPI001867F857|nr:hypothetical protein [Nostoc sp. MG11]